MKTPWPRTLALLLLVPIGFGAGLLLKHRRPATPAAPPVASSPGVPRSCPEADVPTPPLLPGLDRTPVFVDGDAPHLVVQIDGQRINLSPTTPVLLAPGRHALKAEADGNESLAFEFELTAFRAAMVEIETSSATGLTAFFSNVTCRSCQSGIASQPDLSKGTASASALFRRAAAALRANDPRSARAILEQMPPSVRGHASSPADPTYLRLLAIVAAQLGEPAPAAEHTGKTFSPIPEALRVAWLAAKEREEKRRGEVVLERWNLLTTRFSSLLLDFPGVAPGPQSAASSRMADLSAAFLDAARESDFESQDATLAAGEQTLDELTRKVRSTQPADCAFQAAVTTSLRREATDNTAKK